MLKHSVNSSDLAQALRSWRSLLGQEHVFDDASYLSSLSQTTFRTQQQISAVLSPGSVQEVQEVVQIAFALSIPVYPISRGRNWGLGSKVPVQDACVLLDLSRLNRIIEFDRELQYLLVEPGVTFQQASDFLKENSSDLFLSVIGGPPDASIIGNSLERGEGLGPLGLRTRSVAGLEVVLANGEILRTGFSSVPQTKVSGVSELGLGPALDGLFFQSNFGIVVRMRIWLMQRPESFRVFMFTLKNSQPLEPALETVRNLQRQGILKPCSFALWNKYKLLASQQHYPWDRLNGEALDANAVKDTFARVWRNTSWFGFGALYGSTKKIGKLEQREVKSQLSGKVATLRCFNEFSAKIFWHLHPLVSRLSGLDVRDVLNSIYYQSVYLGTPMYTSMKTVYWRKRVAPDSGYEPDRDRCGLIRACHVVPHRPADVQLASDIVETICLESGLEPNTAFLAVSERALHLFVSLIYDRSVEGEDERAMGCFKKISDALNKKGYSAYRLGIHSMDQIKLIGSTERSAIRALKGVFDERNIIAPGRYDS